MDATRHRRTRDAIRQRWYARQRCMRLARLLGFLPSAPQQQGQNCRQK